jgi:hypothetical protein
LESVVVVEPPSLPQAREVSERVRRATRGRARVESMSARVWHARARAGNLDVRSRIAGDGLWISLSLRDSCRR